MAIFEKVKQDATKVLAILLVLHVIAVSFNRAPGKPGWIVGQIWVTSIYVPFQFVAAHGVGSFGAAWHHYFSLRDARVENEQLRKQLTEMQQRVNEAEDKTKFAEQLDTYVKWRSSQSFPAIDARVIARDANQWFNTIVIDQGSLAGVHKDMPVMTPDGLVGRVIEASPVAARVLLLTDERHGVGSIIGQLLNRRSLGVVKGKSAALCEMIFSTATDRVTPNEVVITSGQDGIYPRGLMIGRVKLTPGAPGVPQTLEIVPSAQLDRLDMVAVLQVPKDQIRSKLEDLVQQEAEKQKTDKQQGRTKNEATP